MPDDVEFPPAIEQAMHELALGTDGESHADRLNHLGPGTVTIRAARATVLSTVEDFGVTDQGMFAAVIRGMVIGAHAQKIAHRRKAAP